MADSEPPQNDPAQNDPARPVPPLQDWTPPTEWQAPVVYPPMPYEQYPSPQPQYTRPYEQAQPYEAGKPYEPYAIDDTAWTTQNQYPYPSRGSSAWTAPTPPARSRRRGIVMIALAGVLVVVLVVALVNGLRTHHRASEANPILPSNGATLPNPNPNSTAPGPGTSGGSGQSGGPGGSTTPLVACPLIRDEESHLSYRCIDNYLVDDGTDSSLGLRISLNHEVEPNWVISEGSGNPQSVVTRPPSNTVRFVPALGTQDAAGSSTPPPGGAAASPTPTPTLADVKAEVRDRTALALSLGYGDNPSAKVLDSHTLTISGVTAFQLETEITIDPAFRAAAGLTVKTERLWVVGVPTVAGVSIFMLTIPDERKDLWPKADATVGTIRVI